MQIWTGPVLMNGAIQTFATKTFAMMVRSAVKIGMISMAALYQEMIRNICTCIFNFIYNAYIYNEPYLRLSHAIIYISIFSNSWYWKVVHWIAQFVGILKFRWSNCNPNIKKRSRTSHLSGEYKLWYTKLFRRRGSATIMWIPLPF